MIRDPEVAALRTDLERVGVVVAPHRDHLCVRLPLFASVRVRVDEQGRLDCEPMFGPLARTRALLVGTALPTAIAGGLLYTSGSSPLALTVAFLGIMGALASVCGFVLTENCITRIQLLWTARASGRRDASSPIPVAHVPTPRALEIPAPDVAAEQRSTVESKR